ncbi:MAG TPA: hypothetical protein VFI47_23880 [Acidimicrobiales bacterium]|nr:hypothetical protein [Acidimicrobiales bacterium]
MRTTVVVELDPAEAFEVFTTEMAGWYRRGAASLGRPDRDVLLRLEPGVGGRVLGVAADGGETVLGRVTGWEPGRRLCFVDNRQTEVEVWFEAHGGSTRVVLEHRGLDRLPDDLAAALAQYGWRRLPLWFEEHVKEKNA